MPALSSFDYAVIRVVPRVERAECLNAGVLLFCLERDFLAARVEVDEPRLRDWLAAPRSTIIQVSPVHAGLCESPERALDELFRQMVLVP